MIRYVFAAASAAVVLVLAGCSGSSGPGASGGSGGTPAQTSPSHVAPTTGTAPRTAPRTATSTGAPIVRTVSSTPLGDPATAEVCAGLPLKALSSYGRVSRHGYQAAGQCFTDVQIDRTRLVQVQVGLYSKGQFAGQSTGGVPHTVGTVQTWTFAPQTGSCERAFGTGDVVVDIVAAVFTGSEPGKQLCRIAASAMTAQIASSRNALPTRAAPSPSFTRFDLCALLALPTVRREPGMAGADTPAAHDLGGQCTTITATDQVRLQVVTIDDDFGHPAPSRTVRGRKMQTYSYSGSCEVDVATGAVPGRAAHEYVAAQVFAANNHAKPPAFCRTAQGVMADVLTATGIR